MSGATGWTAEEVATLRRLWADGLPSQEICRRMGRTSGAISGKVDRLGLAPRTQESRAQMMKNKRRAASIASAPIAARPEISQPESPNCVTPFARLLPGQCKWPQGEVEFLFCALPIAGSSPYCAHHSKKAFVTRSSIGTSAGLARK